MGWIYEKTDNNTARFVLGEPGEPGEPNLICIGVNPSTAEPNKLDNTLKTVKAIAIKKGYPGWIMLNLYPQRATNPNDMHIKLDADLHAKNMGAVSEIFRLYPGAIWAAWGTLIEKRSYLETCAADIVGLSIRHPAPLPWVTIGKRSKAGHPHHPLYLNHSAPLEPFNALEYVLINKQGLDGEDMTGVNPWQPKA